MEAPKLQELFKVKVDLSCRMALFSLLSSIPSWMMSNILSPSAQGFLSEWHSPAQSQSSVT